MYVRFNASHVELFTHIKVSAWAWDLSEQTETYLTNNTWWNPSQLESPARVPLAILFPLSHALRGSMVSSIQRCCLFDNNSEGWGRGNGGRKVSFDIDCKIPLDFKKLNWECQV